MLKRVHKGTLHQISRNHQDRYPQKFAGRHNQRKQDAIDMTAVVMCPRWLERGAPNGERTRIRQTPCKVVSLPDSEDVGDGANGC